MADQLLGTLGAAWVDPAKILGSALLGAFAGYWLRGLESRKAEILARVEDTCKEIDALQTVAGKYWSRDTTVCLQDAESIQQEGEIIGRLHSLGLATSSLLEYLPDNYSTDIKADLRELRQNATSAPFASGLGHVQSSASVNGCYQTGANLANCLRRAGRAYNRRWVGFGRRLTP